MRALLIGFGTALVHRSAWMLPWVTPLFLTLVLLDSAEAVFALESVPAILAITREPHLVYTSNIFAVLGLRAMYFALAAMVERFAYRKHTLALILIFVGAKIFYNQFGRHVPPLISLAVILSMIAGGILLSMRQAAGRAPLPSGEGRNRRVEGFEGGR